MRRSGCSTWFLQTKRDDTIENGRGALGFGGGPSGSRCSTNRDDQRGRGPSRYVPGSDLIGSGPASLIRPFLVSTELEQDVEVFQRGDISGGLMAGGDIAQEPSHDLSRARFGQGVGEPDIVGAGQSADGLDDMLAKILAELIAGTEARLEGDEDGDGLTPALVGTADDRSFGHRRVAGHGVLELHGRKPVARDIDHVVNPAQDPVVTLRVGSRAVARVVGAGNE